MMRVRKSQVIMKLKCSNEGNKSTKETVVGVTVWMLEARARQQKHHKRQYIPITLEKHS
jgi:hypothetical protein